MITTYDKFTRLLQIEIESLHDEIELILKSLDQRLAERDYVPCLYALLERKIDRIVDYLRTPVHG